MISKIFLPTSILMVLITALSIHGRSSLKKCDKLIPAASEKTYDTGGNFLRLLTNSKGDKFLIKQVRKISVYTVFKTLLDTLGSSIARKIKIKCNDIELLSSRNTCKHKLNKKLPATIHTFVPGAQQCRASANLYFPFLNLRQIEKKGDERVPSFSKPIITNMARHPDLPAIVALDTFMGNSDRNCYNLFYNARDNSFWTIDFGTLFKRGLCESVFATINQLTSENAALTEAELQALEVYRKTLKKLIMLYPPSILYKMLKKIVVKSDLPFDTEEIRDRMGSLKSAIKKNYSAAEKLEPALKAFIQQNSLKKGLPV